MTAFLKGSHVVEGVLPLPLAKVSDVVYARRSPINCLIMTTTDRNSLVSPKIVRHALCSQLNLVVFGLDPEKIIKLP